MLGNAGVVVSKEAERMAIMRVRGRFGESIVANGGASVPAVQHDYAGDRVQRVSGIFPDNAVNGGICVDVDRE